MENEMNEAKINEPDEKMDLFIKTFKNLVSTSTDSYEEFNFSKSRRNKKWTKETIKRALHDGDADSLRELSLEYFYSSGFYRRLITYYSTMLMFSTLVVPHYENKDQIKRVKKMYAQVLKFVNSLDLPKNGANIFNKVLVEGAYYGILISNGGKSCLMDLDPNYCRSRFKDFNGLNYVEFDVSYFLKEIKDEEKRKACLHLFPKYIQKWYSNYLKGRVDKWVLIESGEGLYLILSEEKPFFTSVIPAIMDFDEYREIEKAKDLQEIRKIIVQKMPLDKDSEVVFEPLEVESMHKAVSQLLSNNKFVDVVTTYGDIKLEELQSTTNNKINNLEKIENSIYSEEGVSKQIFSADKNSSLQVSLKNDLSLVMNLANSLSSWIEFNINRFFGKGRLSFSFSILPISYYNKEEYQKNALMMAQSGYSFLIPFLAGGQKQEDLADIKSLETDILNLGDKLIPLANSYTSSGNPNDEKKDKDGNTNKGKNELEGIEKRKEQTMDDSQKADKTIEIENSR